MSGIIILKAKTWQQITDVNSAFQLPDWHSFSAAQATSSCIQCNREYIVHMFSDAPRVVMLDSGIIKQEDMSNGSKCSSRLSGLGITKLSLSPSSNNIIYSRGKDLTISNIQTDSFNTLYSGGIQWKYVSMNPLDDRCFIAWNDNVVLLWNKASCESHMLQYESTGLSTSNNSSYISNSIIIRYTDPSEICYAYFLVDYVIVTTTTGHFDIFSAGLSPGEYYRSFRRNSLLSVNSKLADVTVTPIRENIKYTLALDAFIVLILSLTGNIIHINIWKLPIDPANTEEDLELIQNITLHSTEPLNNSTKLRFVGPFWGDFIGIQISNQLILCYLSSQRPIKAMYLLPSRLLDAAAIRPPPYTTWIDIKNQKNLSKDIPNRLFLELFISNIFGGLESIILPPIEDVDKLTNTQYDNGTTPQDLFLCNITSNTTSNDTNRDITADYYAAIMQNSGIKPGSVSLQHGNMTTLSSDRSDILSSLFGALNLEHGSISPQIESSSTPVDNGSILDTSAIVQQIKTAIEDEIQKSLVKCINTEFKCLINSSIKEIYGIMEKEIKTILTKVDSLEKTVKEDSKKLSNMLRQVETLTIEYGDKISVIVQNSERNLNTLIDSSNNCSEQLSILKRSSEAARAAPLDDLAQVIADSFGTLTSAVTQLQESVTRIEHTNSNFNTYYVTTSTIRDTPSKISSFGDVSRQIEDCLYLQQYDKAFAIAISTDQANLSTGDMAQSSPNCGSWVMYLACKFDPCIWLDNEPLPISHPVLLGIARTLSDTLPPLISALSRSNHTVNNSNALADLKFRILWIKEAIHCFEPFTDTLLPDDITQLLNEILSRLNQCLLLLEVSESTKNHATFSNLADGIIVHDLTSVVRHIKRIIRTISYSYKQGRADHNSTSTRTMQQS
ncbi:hypothetical protein cand_007380 [Cryptosporidium andersoni]|uniref:Uncharacterized protein n=1 Tax=Cryptosporidium andersoni TaxID=117008 RepID=A0A1J4MP90_9CRYT|nr:hypothetical protein cand_007380 [Cryptosporidium andersoni]